MPNNIIFRRIQEITGMSLDEYIQTKKPIFAKQDLVRSVSNATEFSEVEAIDIILKILALTA